jgi:hypothetical protein
MRSSLSRLVGRGALLAALGSATLGVAGAASVSSDAVNEAAEWNWLSVTAHEPLLGDDTADPTVTPTDLEEEWNWV